MLGILGEMYALQFFYHSLYSQECGCSEHLRSVPDTLESLISEKRLLHAANLLMKSLKTIKKTELLEIGAISDLRTYLIGQETVRLQFSFVDIS